MIKEKMPQRDLRHFFEITIDLELTPGCMM